MARLPFYGLTFWLSPVAELTVGTMLILGIGTRLAAVVVLAMMLGAIYVHLVVDDPSVFPLQPKAPITPVVVGLTIFVLVGGSRT